MYDELVFFWKGEGIVYAIMAKDGLWYAVERPLEKRVGLKTLFRMNWDRKKKEGTT